jgi:hypothetical protein
MHNDGKTEANKVRLIPVGMVKRLFPKRGDEIMHIAVDVGPTDLVLDPEVVSDRFQAVRIVGDQNFGSQGMCQIPNPQFRVKRGFRGQEIKGERFPLQDGRGDGDDSFVTLAFHMGEVHTQHFNLTGQSAHSLLPQLNGSLTRRLNIFVDGRLAQRILQRVE